MRKLTTTIICVFAYSVLQAQHMKGYWFLAEGINYYYIDNAIPGSGAAFYSASGGGRLLEQQKVGENGTLLYVQPYSPDLTPYSWMDSSPSASAYYKVAIRGRENDVSYLSRPMNANTPVATAYPTTVTNFINVDISSAEGKNTYKIHDLKGRLLQKGNLTGRQNTIRVTDLAKGTYLLSVYTAQGNATQKIIRK